MSSWGELAPYIVLVFIGFLPNEIWRMLGVVVSRGLNEDSEILVWVRAVATAILAGVVGKIVVFAPGALASVPLTIRIASVVIGFSGFLLMRGSVLAGVCFGTAALVIGTLVFAA